MSREGAISEPRDSSEPVPLTSASTMWFGRVAPALGIAALWLAIVRIWMGGPEEGITVAVKSTAVGIAAAASVALGWWYGHLRHVWLDGDYIVIGDARRGVRVRLQDVREVKETRLHKLKWVKLRLAHQTPLGDTIRFIPRGHAAWLTPWTASPLVEELRRRVEAAREGGGPGRLGP